MAVTKNTLGLESKSCPESMAAPTPAASDDVCNDDNDVNDKDDRDEVMSGERGNDYKRMKNPDDYIVKMTINEGRPVVVVLQLPGSYIVGGFRSS